MIRRDARSKLAARPKDSGPGYTHPFTAPSLTYRALPVIAGAFIAMRALRSRRVLPREPLCDQLRVAVWENEGGSEPPLEPPSFRREICTLA